MRKLSPRRNLVLTQSGCLVLAALVFVLAPARARVGSASPSESSALAASQHGAGTVTPAVAMEELLAGNRRFVAGTPSHPEQDAARRASLVTGQAPHAVILSCSDSRVPPEIVFDRGLGELFVVRVAGNVLGPATVASIEYAVEHLGCPLIVVMGHESCGAVKTALTVAPLDAGSTDLGALVTAILKYVRGVKDAALADPTLTPAVKANVNGVCGQLLKSRIVREHVDSGRVEIAPAIYRLETGEVEFWHAGGTVAAGAAAPHH